MGWSTAAAITATSSSSTCANRSGIAQIVLDKELTPGRPRKANRSAPSTSSPPSARSACGDADAINPKMPTGENRDLKATQLLVLNDSRLAPFRPLKKPSRTRKSASNTRYVDLRRPEMQRNFRLRHDITLAIRESLQPPGLPKIETPILTKSTPRGAAIFWFPARVHPVSSTRSAVPANLQQILMISGFDATSRSPLLPT